jgi:hypothetical protein
MTTDEAFRFFCFTPMSKINFDNFFFCVSYFNINFTLSDAHTLFQTLDQDNKGHLGYDEFRVLYGKVHDKDYSEPIRQLIQSSLEQNAKRNPKLPLKIDEIMDYPHFFKQKKANLANARKLKINSISDTESMAAAGLPRKQDKVNGMAARNTSASSFKTHSVGASTHKMARILNKTEQNFYKVGEDPHRAGSV